MTNGAREHVDWHGRAEGAGSTLALVNSLACGALLIALSMPHGPVHNSYAGWDRYLR